MLFNLEFADSIVLNNIEKLKIRGLGEGEPIDAIKSKGNLFKMNGIVNPDLHLFVITENLFDLSAKIGVDIHGIIGGDLLKNFIVKWLWIKWAPKKCIILLAVYKILSA